MKITALIAFFLTLGMNAAWADSCGKSREYLLNNEGDLNLSSKTYDDLFKLCIATAAMTNVKDAFILKDGGIGAIAKHDTIAETAATLSQFCDAYPRATLHFLTQRELVKVQSIANIVRISSTSSTSCQKIKGLSE
jgi:hypothetical protein